MTENNNELHERYDYSEAINAVRNKEREQQGFEPAFKEESVKHPYTVELSESDLEQLDKLFNLGLAKSKEIITRAEKYPTYNIKSKVTIEKHESIISHIESLRNKFNQ